MKIKTSLAKKLYRKAVNRLDNTEYFFKRIFLTITKLTHITEQISNVEFDDMTRIEKSQRLIFYVLLAQMIILFGILCFLWR